MSEGYKVEIIAASRELNVREKIALKDLANAKSLDTLLNDVDSYLIQPVDYAELAVHNERSKQDKDYKKYLILDANGEKYVTGSDSFWTAFRDIFDTMRAEAPDEVYSIEVLKKPSQNYKGKSFLTCSLSLI